MVRYKMLGRDTNSSPTQYRTWIVEDTPDLTGELYTGLKSGPEPLIDISAYVIYDDDTVADFNLPDPLTWKTTYHTLPEGVSHSALGIVDGYAYLFGGRITNKIFKASLDNPAEWEDTGATLPLSLFGSQLAVVDDTIYLFGGESDGYVSDHIFSASTSDPLTWTDEGSQLPSKVRFSQLSIIDDFIYLFGGKEGGDATDEIMRASTSSPLSWTSVGALPAPTYGSQLAIIDGYAYLYGGVTTHNTPTALIYACETTSPTSWFVAGELPYKSFNAQVAVVNKTVYLYGPTYRTSTVPGQTKIMISVDDDPAHVIDALVTVPGEVSSSQLGIIYDRLFLFGGNGSSVVFASGNKLKYKLASSAAVLYGEVTRTEVSEAPSTLDLFVILGMPPWKTNYGS